MTAAENVIVYNYAYLNGGYSGMPDNRLKADVQARDTSPVQAVVMFNNIVL